MVVSALTSVMLFIETLKICPPLILNDSATSHQAASLRQLEEENHEAAARLEEVVYRGDMLLEKIQSALADIAQSQLRTRNGAPSQSSAAESWSAFPYDFPFLFLPSSLKHLDMLNVCYETVRFHTIIS